MYKTMCKTKGYVFIYSLGTLWLIVTLLYMLTNSCQNWLWVNIFTIDAIMVLQFSILWHSEVRLQTFALKVSYILNYVASTLVLTEDSLPWPCKS